MNKFIIQILVIAIAGFFILQTPAFSEPKMPIAKSGKCGDEICDDKEKANPKLCPKDCQQTTPTPTPTSSPTTTPSSYQDSPFGIYSPYSEILEGDKVNFTTAAEISKYLKDLGVKWVQEGAFTSYFQQIPQEMGSYSRIGREGGMSPKKIDDESIVEKYKTEVTGIVKKNKNRTKYWEISTEPDGVGGYNSNPAGYAKLLKISYKTIKSECPDCKVIFGGLSGINRNLDNKSGIFLEEVLKAGGVQYFDGLEFKQHHISASQYLLLKEKFDLIGGVLSKYGIDIKKIPVFVEGSMYDGDPNSPVAKALIKGLPIQTEAEQASGLIKDYVYGVSFGIDKFFWNLLYERNDYLSGKTGMGNFPQNPFNHYGLIHNQNNSDGLSHKKLAYYTYKKMVEILEGSDWNNIQTIQESDGVYIYKFTKNGKPIYVAWNDNSGEKQITISSITSGSAKITEAVPKYDSGKDVSDYSAAFNTETESVADGKITITLKDKPVYVEGK
ncbi:MAG: hypothetical protein HY035_10000 [Nitrospirae bacterium]|nr:hypothetical protein [Nitrospirota bacterium]